MENYTIIQDTREQKPLKFGKQPLERSKLDVGDYGCRWKSLVLPLVFERKSAADLYGTLGKGHKRFKKEIERSIVNNQILYVIVESDYLSIKNKTFPNANLSRMRGFVVMKVIHTIEIKYGVKFIFTNSRKESSEIIRGMFDAIIRQLSK